MNIETYIENQAERMGLKKGATFDIYSPDGRYIDNRMVENTPYIEDEQPFELTDGKSILWDVKSGWNINNIKPPKPDFEMLLDLTKNKLNNIVLLLEEHRFDKIKTLTSSNTGDEFFIEFADVIGEDSKSIDLVDIVDELKRLKRIRG